MSDVTVSSIVKNGSLIYTPSANFNGSDSFTYKVNNGIEDSNIGIISILINKPPIANNMNIIVNKNTHKIWPIVIPIIKYPICGSGSLKNSNKNLNKE